MSSPKFRSYLFARKMVLDRLPSFEEVAEDKIGLIGWVNDFYEVMVRRFLSVFVLVWLTSYRVYL